MQTATIPGNPDLTCIPLCPRLSHSTRGMQDLRCATAGAGRHRLLLAEPLPPLTATINLPPQHAGTTCTMQSLGMCASPGPYAGVECSGG